MCNMSYIIVDKDIVKRMRRKLLELKSLREDAKVRKISDRRLALPVRETSELWSAINTKTLLEDGSFTFVKDISIMEERKKPHEFLRETVEVFLKVKKMWRDDLEKEIPKSWIKHGDLALFDRKYFVDPVWKKGGDELWSEICAALKVKRLAKRFCIQSDDFRSPKVEILYGDSSWVTAVDHGISWDIKLCMYSPGNGTEKCRVSKMNCKGEVVVDMYAGIGYFTLPFLIHAEAACIHACEWNPAAVMALQYNLMENKVSDRCIIHVGDNREVCPENIADRVYLGLIPTCQPGIITACKAIKFIDGGILHLHENVSSYRNMSNFSSHDLQKTMSEVTSCQQCLCIFGKMSEMLPEYFSEDSEVPSFSFFLEGSEGNAQWCKNKCLVCKKKEWFIQAIHFAHIVSSFLTNFHGRVWRVELLDIFRVKSYAPHIDHLVYDFLCSPVESAETS